MDMRTEPRQQPQSSHTLFIDCETQPLLHDEIDRLQALHSLDSCPDSLQLPLSVRNSPRVSASARLNCSDRHLLRDPG
jgi:hypothetical protein